MMTIIQSNIGCYIEFAEVTMSPKNALPQHIQCNYDCYNTLTKQTLKLSLVDANEIKMIRHQDKIYRCIQVPPIFGGNGLVHDTRTLKSLADTIEIKRTYELRDNQKEIIESMKNKSVDDKIGDSLIFVLPTGFGKTIIAMECIIQAKVNTLLIVCPKTILVEQWIEALTGQFGQYYQIYNYVKSKFIEGDSPKIYVTTIQTLTSRQKQKDHTQMIKSIDMVIYDEIHMFPTSCFKETFLAINPLKRIGLTATLERKDCQHTLFKYFFEATISYDKSAIPKKQSTLYIQLMNHTAIKQPDPIKLYCGPNQPRKEVPSCAQMINILADDHHRTTKVIEYAFNKFDNDKRYWLIVTDRVNHVKQIKDALIAKLVPKGTDQQFIDEILIITGGTKKNTIDLTKRIIIATYGVVNQGFNVPALNTLLLMTPRSQVIQIFGRIYRQKHELTPLIIDVIDNHWLFHSQGQKRKTQAMNEISNLQCERHSISPVQDDSLTLSRRASRDLQNSIMTSDALAGMFIGDWDA